MSVDVGLLDENDTLDIVAANYNYPYTTANIDDNNAGSWDSDDFGGMLLVYWNGSTTPDTIDDTKRGYEKVLIVDVDNDDILDVIVGCINLVGEDGNNFYYINNGNKTFDSAQGFSGDHKQDTHDIAAGDLNNDGKIDIIEAGINGKVYSWLNQGSGTVYTPAGDNLSSIVPIGSWNPTTSMLGDAFLPGAVIELGDMNQDGLLDLFVSVPGKVKVFEHNGAGLYYNENDYWTIIDNNKKPVSCASFGWCYYDDERYLGLAAGSFTHKNQGGYDQRGKSIFIKKDSIEGTFLYEVWLTGQDTVGTDTCYQLCTDIRWGYVDNDDTLDIIGGSYPTLYNSGTSLSWQNGYNQYYLNPELEDTPDRISAEWNTICHDFTAGIALGDLYGDDLTQASASRDSLFLSDTTLFYFDYFPVHKIDSIKGYREDNGYILNQDSLSYCYNLQCGWISFGDSPSEDYDSIAVYYKYSKEMDLIVGNDGANRIYFNGGSGSTASAETPVNFTIQTHYADTTGEETDSSYMDLNGAIGLAMDGPDPDWVNVILDEMPDTELFTYWFYWGGIEFLRGHYFWDKADRVLDEFLSDNRKVVLFVDGETQWGIYPQYREGGASYKFFTADQLYHGYFVRNIVNRYREDGVLDSTGAFSFDAIHNIDVFQFTNEPNLKSYSYRDYSNGGIESIRDRMKYDYGVVHSIDDDLILLSPNFGGLDYLTHLSYLDTLYAADHFADGGQALRYYADYMANQNYYREMMKDPEQTNSSDSVMFWLDNMMTVNDDSAKPFVTNEWSYLMEPSIDDEEEMRWVPSYNAKLFSCLRTKWSCYGVLHVDDDELDMADQVLTAINQQAKLLNGYKFKENNTYYDITAEDDTLTTIKDYIFDDPNDDEKYVHQIRTDSLSIENTLKIQLETDTLDIDGDHAAIDYLNDNHFERQVNEDDAVGYGWVTFLEAEIDTTPLYLSEIVDGTNYDLDIIIEPERWRMISMNLQHENDPYIDDIFADFVSDSLEVWNYEGEKGIRDDNTWTWPQGSFTWNQYQGYLVWSEDADTLSISDNEWWGVNDTFDIDPEDFTDTTRNNYFIAYTPCWDMPCSTAFYQLLHWTNRDCVVFYYATSVNQGLTYLPEHSGQSDYYMMRQGEGYFLRFKADSVLHGFYFTTDDTSVLDSYNGKPGANENDINSTVEMHYQPHWPSQDLYPIVLEDIEINGVTPTEDDEIGVFMWDSVLVGAKNFTSEDGFVITAWEDDIMTEEVDGYIEGETMSFKFWDASAEQEYDLDLSYTISNALQTDLPYSTNPIFGSKNYAMLSFGATLKGDLLPEKYALHQNYPNPFNPTTTIRFDLPDVSKVKLEVYNILGQKVTTLMDQVCTAGFKSIRWNASELASGMYIYRIKTESLTDGEKFASVKKMVLIK